MRTWLGAGCLAAIVLVASCGGGSSQRGAAATAVPDAGPPSQAAAPDSGTVTASGADAGTVAPDSADAGTVTSSGSADAGPAPDGSGTTTTTSAGPPAPPAPPPSPPSPPSSTPPTPPGSPPPPGPPAACAQVATVHDVPVRQYVARPAGPVACGPGVGDGHGALLLLMNVDYAMAHGSLLDFLGGELLLREQAASFMNPHALQQPDGFTALADAPRGSPGGSIRIGHWDAQGNALGEGGWLAERYASTADPRGGVLLAGDLSDGYPVPLAHAVVMFTGGGVPHAVRWGPVRLAAAGAVVGAGVDVQGRALVLTDGSGRFGAATISGQWFEDDGAAATGEFLVDAGAPGQGAQDVWYEASPLVGGGVAVLRLERTPGDHAVHGTVRAIVQSASASVGPAPAWMTDRPDARWQLTPGGTGYAVLPLAAAAAPCRQRLELLAADGTACGAAEFALGADACDTRDLALGADGTVIQPLPGSMETVVDPGSPVHTCSWRLWPRAVR